MDVVTAFFPGLLSTTNEIFVHLPQGLGENSMVKLHEELYGSLQAPLVWYQRLRSYILHCVFRASSVNNCVFTKGVKEKKVTVLVYVDDLLFVSNLDEEVPQLKKNLCKEFTMKDIRLHQTFLGIEFCNTRDGFLQHQSDNAT